ncbi:MAG: DUF3783 domain-containing protein [Oscillospiraceae bacterium]|nr:DUF3783 domain-containing protein [Oscillospiraceae bacterium]
MRPKVLLYRLGKETEKGKVLCTVLDDMKLLTLHVKPEQLGETAGRLASTNAAATGVPPENVPESEFMLLCGLGDRQLDRLLAAMRRAGVSVPCKAVLTEYNKEWQLWKLMEEVAREHELMKGSH